MKKNSSKKIVKEGKKFPVKRFPVKKYSRKFLPESNAKNKKIPKKKQTNERKKCQRFV